MKEPKKRKDKRKRESEAPDKPLKQSASVDSPEDFPSDQMDSKLRKKVEKKERKRKHHHEESENREKSDDRVEAVSHAASDEDKAQASANEAVVLGESQAIAKKDRHAAKRAERKRLMELVPKVDKDGITYTKLQLRRMRKRVGKGLDPVETEKERNERLSRDAELRRDEEAELAGTVYRNDVSKGRGVEDEDANNDDKSEAGGDDDAEEENHESGHASGAKPSVPLTKKARRDKAVPVDYVCSACANKHTPRHWIYDCPDKKTIRGANQISKKLKGLHNPERKVFVSGLPFDVKRKDIESLFGSCGGGKLIHIKLLQFPDTGRCRGQAILAFDSDEAATKALTLNGTTLGNKGTDGDKKGKSQRKELKLTVSKAMNRTLTKKE